MARPCPCLPTPGILCTELILRANFLGAEVSGTVPNGSERFRRPQVCTVKKQLFLVFSSPSFKTFQKAALWLQGPRIQEQRVREKAEEASP